MPRTHSDEWWEQGVRCRLYDKKGKPGVPEYVTCFNDGWPKNERLMVYVKAGERPTEAVLSYDKFSKAVAFAQAYSAGADGDETCQATPQEDIDHFLLHGTFLHGEWFLEGQRCPGGDHREELPTGITERPLAPADFPEARQRLDEYDGCPNQFAYSDQFHQIAVWRAKTARWAKHRLADAAAAAAIRHFRSCR